MKHSKILICGIHGDIVGLGVTILPLFDVIISSESTTFATTYGKYGCMPEGLSIVRPGQFLHKAFVRIFNLIKVNYFFFNNYFFLLQND